MLAGGYVLRRAAAPQATLVGTGAVVPETLAAAEELGRLGVEVDVVCVTSADRLFRACRARRALDASPSWILDVLFPAARARPMVTVHDGHPHALSFLPAINGVPGTHLGVDAFGQSGSLQDVYRSHDIDVSTIIGACVDLIE